LAAKAQRSVDVELPTDGRLARGVVRRHAIVEAATRLFARGGYGVVSVEELATAAGVSGPGVYRHFGGKEEILAAVIDQTAPAMFDPLPATGPPEARLRAFFERLAATTALHGQAISIATRDWPNLAEAARRSYRRSMAQRVDELAGLMRQWRPGVAEADAFVAVDVAIGVAVHIGHLGTGAHLTEERTRTLLPDLAMAVLAAAPENAAANAAGERSTA
jgi:AcrR family transcriptional regulator